MVDGTTFPYISFNNWISIILTNDKSWNIKDPSVTGQRGSYSHAGISAITVPSFPPSSYRYCLLETDKIMIESIMNLPVAFSRIHVQNHQLHATKYLFFAM